MILNFPKKERWAVYNRKTGIDIIPVDDVIEHVFDVCPCKPTLDTGKNNSTLYIHHSFDGREIMEEVFDKIKR